ncbi:MAG: hypothetical protein KF878_10660 [Planctomycetes bacterium]|nr:hypothetical protein [Planctomycetota bacterium]
MRRWLALVVALAGCASSHGERAPALDPRADRRVALLPFADRHTGDHPTAYALAWVADGLPFLADEALAASRAAAVMREKVQGELRRRTRFDLLPLPAVDAALDGAGFDPVALAPGDRAAAARALGRRVGADLVVFGDVTEWSREFWLVQSHATVAFSLEVRDAATGEVVYTGGAEDTAHSGLSQVPLPLATEFLEVPVWILIELVRGLSAANFNRLSDDVAAAALDALAPTIDQLTEAAPPRLDLVAHSAAGPLRAGDDLVVVARGEPGARASFRVGRGRWSPMTETAPGSYRGALVVSPGHRWLGEPVEVRLVGPAGRGATRALARPTVTSAQEVE